MADDDKQVDLGEGAAIAAAVSPAKSGGGGTSPLVIVLLLLNLLVMGGVGFLQFQFHSKMKQESQIKDVVKAQMKEDADAKSEADEAAKGEKKGEKAALVVMKADHSQGYLLPLEGFTANLAQGDGPKRYARITLVLKFSPDSKEEEFKARQPQIRDAIIALLNAKRAEDLVKVEGKNYLKEEVKAAINAFLIDGTLEDVYYIGFVIN
ncbi:MAG: flagellar basal body-associated FliL family protein [Oligoflexia bacterium]|nr:flagellar basal body-associated FliL family protein [Oligoflexia bacterium]MBF0364597.1 flagellar basal body-associated FliL family protein [Oligoflexia bacterium]